LWYAVTSPAVLLSAAVGLLIVLGRPRNLIGWVLLASALALGCAFLAEPYARYALLTDPGSLPAARWAVLWDEIGWPTMFGGMADRGSLPPLAWCGASADALADLRGTARAGGTGRVPGRGARHRAAGTCDDGGDRGRRLGDPGRRCDRGLPLSPVRYRVDRQSHDRLRHVQPDRCRHLSRPGCRARPARACARRGRRVGRGSGCARRAAAEASAAGARAALRVRRSFRSLCCAGPAWGALAGDTRPRRGAFDDRRLCRGRTPARLRRDRARPPRGV